MYTNRNVLAKPACMVSVITIIAFGILFVGVGTSSSENLPGGETITMYSKSNITGWDTLEVSNQSLHFFLQKNSHKRAQIRHKMALP